MVLPWCRSQNHGKTISQKNGAIVVKHITFTVTIALLLFLISLHIFCLSIKKSKHPELWFTNGTQKKKTLYESADNNRNQHFSKARIMQCIFHPNIIHFWASSSYSVMTNSKRADFIVAADPLGLDGEANWITYLKYKYTVCGLVEHPLPTARNQRTSTQANNTLTHSEIHRCTSITYTE